MKTAKPLDVRIHQGVDVDPESGCWIWRGAKRPDGYVQIRVAGRLVYAHRVAYEVFVGPIPDGLTLDHVVERGCKSRACVNPSHLEPVTHRENCLRGTGVSAVAIAKTHCPQNHPYDDENTKRGSKGERLCRICDAEAKRRYKQRQRKAVAA